MSTALPARMMLKPASSPDLRYRWELFLVRRNAGRCVETLAQDTRPRLHAGPHRLFSRHRVGFVLCHDVIACAHHDCSRCRVTQLEHQNRFAHVRHRQQVVFPARVLG